MRRSDAFGPAAGGRSGAQRYARSSTPGRALGERQLLGVRAQRAAARAALAQLAMRARRDRVLAGEHAAASASSSASQAVGVGRPRSARRPARAGRSRNA